MHLPELRRHLRLALADALLDARFTIIAPVHMLQLRGWSSMTGYVDVCERCGERLGACTCPGGPVPFLPLESAAFHGPVGDLALALTPTTTADPAGMLGVALVEVGALCWPSPTLSIEGDTHPPGDWVALVGTSADGGKGSAASRVRSVTREVEEDWHGVHEVSGLGSGEALVAHAAEHPGAAVLIDERELAHVLTVIRREGSTLSSTLRNAWDYRRLRSQVKDPRKRLDAPPTLVAMLAHVTPAELLDATHGLGFLGARNGLGNRWLWLHVQRRRELDDGARDLTPGDRAGHVRALRAGVDAARARSSGTLDLSPDARAFLLDDLLPRVRPRSHDESVAGMMAARAPAHVRRLSLVYALVDGADVVEVTHLRAAAEVWRYSAWSVAHVWGRSATGTGDVILDRAWELLLAGERLTGRDLDRLHGGNRSSEMLRDSLVALGAVIESGSSGRKGGRPPVVVFCPEGQTGVTRQTRDLREPWFVRSGATP